MSCSTPRPLVGGEIVHDDGLAGREYGDEACLHPILEQGGVDRSEKSLPPLGREGEGRRPKSPFYSDCAGWPPASGARAGNVRVCARDWWRLLSSSMKTSFVGSRSSCPANHSRRRFCTSARCCSSAC